MKQSKRSIETVAEMARHVGRLAGQPVRLRFVMKDADLFSFRFRNDDAETPCQPDAGADT